MRRAVDYNGSKMRWIVLMGPQRLQPIVASALAARGVRGRIATVTAGWEMREDEDAELDEHLGGRTVNLRLYGRATELLEADKDLAAAYRERRDRLRRSHELYRLRLDHAIAAVKAVMTHLEKDEPLLRARAGAIQALRALDDEHLVETGEIRDDFAALASEHPGVLAQREELGELVAELDAVAIAGGHVGVLLRLFSLFDFTSTLSGRPVVAWSAGAMALGTRVVLFHDRPPQRAGNAEVLEYGLGLYPSVLPLPHARRRLRLDDPVRVAVFSRRFAPLEPITMDEGVLLEWDGSAWSYNAPAKRLLPDGSLEVLGD